MSGKWGNDSLQNKVTRRFNLKFGQIAVLCGRVFLVAAVVYLAVYAYHSALDPARAGNYFELRSVDVQGSLHLDKEALGHLVRRTVPSNILSINLDHVREIVETETWVRRATVRRKLPGRLLIYVTERKPEAVAAIDGALYVVDKEGVTLDSFGAAYRQLDGPIVKGLHNSARENAVEANRRRMQLYLEVIADLAGPPNRLDSISEIDVTQPSRVAVVPKEEPVPVFLGSGRFRARYETFLSQKEVYYRIKEQHGSVEYVDVTYDQKIIFHTPGQNVIG